MGAHRNAVLSLSLGVAALAVAGCAGLAPETARPHVIAEQGRSDVCIVVADDASPSTRYAAEELQRFLGEMTGAEFPIVSDREPVAEQEIVLGDNAHLDALGVMIDFDALGMEGYVLRSAGSHLVIAGGEPRGTLYGVYGLLEDHLGCRWFTPEVQYIPKADSLIVGAMDEQVVPVLEYREPFVMDCFDGDWAARNRMNSSAARLEERHGGKVTYFGFVHTFDQLVPPELYFDEHPEYFALVKGERLKERTQLCCTNEDVVDLVIEEVRRRMGDHPEATVFSVSQNDWHNFCTCRNCASLAEAQDSEMAPVLYLVNRVADAVRDEFPGKVIDTLAYQWTRKPCRSMRPRPNVIIRLCSIECCFSHSFENCNSRDNRSFVEDVEGWSHMCDRLWVWNYNTSFSNYFTPFPNLAVRAPNIRFFAANNVRGIFEQDVYTTLNGEFSGLSGYLGAKLLWDPEYDPDVAIDEFLDGVYGAAAPSIRSYLDLIHERVAAENIHMNIWIGPDHPCLTEEILAKAEGFWEAAEAAAANQAEVLERVRAARLSVDYAIIERMRTRGLGAYDVDHQAFTIERSRDYAARAERFFAVAERNGVTQIRESGGAVAKYKELVFDTEEGRRLKPHAAVAVANAQPGLRYQYYTGPLWEQLPDFSTLTPAAEGVAQRVSLRVAETSDLFGLVFSGYFHAPEDGVYLFVTSSNDGSRLHIGGELVVDNDGLHSVQSRFGLVGLRAGYHPIRIEYFESENISVLEVRCMGPGIKEGRLRAERLFHTP